MSKIEIALQKLKDLPITKDKKNWFVNRQEDLISLENAAKIYIGNIIGITGERGVGKTSLFNLFLPNEGVIINVIDRDTKIGIILDILYELYEFAKSRYMKEIQTSIKNAINDINISLKTSLTFSFSSIVGVAYRHEKSEQIDLYSIIKKVKNIIENITKRTELIIIIDEIDKEKKKELFNVLDVLKDLFNGLDVVVIVSLPWEFTDEYRKSKESVRDSYNLENIVKKIIEIKPLSNESLEELFFKRTGFKLEEIIEKKALDLLYLYSSGNPRKFILTLKEAGFIEITTTKNEKITYYAMTEAIKPFLETYFKNLDLSENDKKIAKIIKETTLEENIKNIIHNGFSKQVAYKYIKRIENKGLISIINSRVIFNNRFIIAKQLKII